MSIANRINNMILDKKRKEEVKNSAIKFHFKDKYNSDVTPNFQSLNI
jgi:hypothetical protein